MVSYCLLVSCLAVRHQAAADVLVSSLWELCCRQLPAIMFEKLTERPLVCTGGGKRLLACVLLVCPVSRQLSFGCSQRQRAFLLPSSTLSLAIGLPSLGGSITLRACLLHIHCLLLLDWIGFASKARCKVSTADFAMVCSVIAASRWQRQASRRDIMICSNGPTAVFLSSFSRPPFAAASGFLFCIKYHCMRFRH